MGFFNRQADPDKIRRIAQAMLDEHRGRGITPATALAMAEMEVYGTSGYDKRATHASKILEKYGWTEAGPPTPEEQMLDEVSRRGYRSDAEVVDDARKSEGGRVSPCPRCSGPSAMDLKPKQVKHWLRLRGDEAAGSYALACSNCGSRDPLPAGMLDWAVQAVAGVDQLLGPEKR